MSGCLSRRTTQLAVGALRKRSLIAMIKRGPTEAPEYRPLFPCRR